MGVKYQHTYPGKVSASFKRASFHKNTGKTEVFNYVIFSDFGSRLLRKNMLEGGTRTLHWKGKGNNFLNAWMFVLMHVVIGSADLKISFL